MPSSAPRAAERDHARAAERAHVSHELHDGVIQSLLGVKLQLAAVRLRPDVPADAGGALAALDATLAREISGLRVAMFELAPTDTGLSLQDGLSDLIARFHHATGINTSVEFDLRTSLPPSLAHELARILQESLVNVRRHTEATQVRVRLIERDALHMTVEDNGHGFPFDGRLSSDDGTRLLREGPRVLVERVRALGGHVTIWSTPSIGAQIEVTLPIRRWAGSSVPGLASRSPA